LFESFIIFGLITTHTFVVMKINTPRYVCYKISTLILQYKHYVTQGCPQFCLDTIKVVCLNRLYEFFIIPDLITMHNFMQPYTNSPSNVHQMCSQLTNYYDYSTMLFSHKKKILFINTVFKQIFCIFGLINAHKFMWRLLVLYVICFLD
jgi:hypothetical protein